ncbi:MAG: hypothetical protein KKH34_07230, partial [Candidatus Omnitrophica bacterium]|nr:hypothetical protein [Candidatus Omnitrophota bacterium]
MKRNILFRGVSIAVIWSFIFVNMSFAVAGGPLPAAQKIAPPLKDIPVGDILKMEIPVSWGIIKDAYNAGTDKLIINVQDAHCDFEA